MELKQYRWVQIAVSLVFDSSRRIATYRMVAATTASEDRFDDIESLIRVHREQLTSELEVVSSMILFMGSDGSMSSPPLLIHPKGEKE